jgi:hypothetical protein
LFTSSAFSNYNSLQVQLRGRDARHGLEFGSSFTWSHAIDNASDFFDSAGDYALPQDSLQPSERASSNYDIRLMWVTHFVWNIPSVLPTAVFRDWQISGIVTERTGQPYTVNSIYDINQDGNLTDRLDNTIGLLPGGSGRVRLILTTDPLNLLSATEKVVGATGCITSNSQGKLLNSCDGSVGRNTFRADGLHTADVALTRSLAVRERMTILFRAEAFNLLNHSNFAIPVRLLRAPGFGAAVQTSVPNRVLQVSMKIRF